MGDITRHLSEASADAESFFAEQSHRMDLEQLQRYAMLQNQLDSLTVQVFETEIAHNQKVINEAWSPGADVSAVAIRALTGYCVDQLRESKS